MQWFPKLKKLEWLVLISLVIGYLALTLTSLTKLPIFVDEALYLRWAQIAWHDASWRFISLTDGKQPLYIWFVIPFMKVIADPLYAGRLASVVAGLGTVLGMGYLAWLLQGKKMAFYAMLVSVCSPYLFFYYRFGIMESLLVATIIWVLSLSVLLARTRRLDIALILGMVTGAALLVKSSALFFALFIPASYILELNFKKIVSKQTVRYLLLVLLVWLLAGIIYNVQRLSPWMHMIAQKNAFFVVPYSEIFRETQRLTNNFFDVWRWQWAYTTGGILLAAAVGLYRLSKKSWRQALLITLWFLGPVLGTVALARLFAPRYIIYATPFILLAAAYAFTTLKARKSQIIAVSLAMILPLYLIVRLISNPVHFPYVNVDEGYVNGWSAGNGAQQIADWAVARVESTGQPITIYTEGTFGILPHGVELYADGRTDKLTIVGLYPIEEIPPTETLESVKTNKETYLILNNTFKADVPPGLELVTSYPKLRENPMNLYRVLPVAP